MAPTRTAGDLDDVTYQIIGAAIEVHRQYGPGLLESAYLPPMEEALAARRLAFQRESAIQRPALKAFARRYRADLIVEESIVVELKAVDRILAVHAAQLRTYLRLSGCPVGLILNFNAAVLKDGIKRVVNNFPEEAPISDR